MRSILRPALTLFVALSLLTGLVYPLAMTGIARLAFPDQAAGSLLLKDGRPVGSTLIGQAFDDPVAPGTGLETQGGVDQLVQHRAGSVLKQADSIHVSVLCLSNLVPAPGACPDQSESPVLEFKRIAGCEKFRSPHVLDVADDLVLRGRVSEPTQSVLNDGCGEITDLDADP